MTSSKKLDRRGSGLMFWLILGLVTFVLYSGLVAWNTANDCGHGVDKTWQLFPPGWECKGRLAGYG